jgi:hypothetical protein
MLSLIATVIILLAFGGFTVLADETEKPEPTIVASGYCGSTSEGNGENISWELDSNGLLTVSGTGRMKEFTVSNSPWKDDNRIREAVISNGITNIGTFAFYGCTSLVSVEIPDSVVTLGQGSFEGCVSLDSIVIPDSVTSIGISAFQGCTGLTSITIPGSVTGIGTSAFEDCTGLTSITIPDSATSIGPRVFKECTGLTSFTIPDSVTSIGSGAFQGCTGLSSITIPDSVTSIGSGAFQGCTGLSSITIPDSVTSIGGMAFGNCINITSLIIDVDPNSFNDGLNSIFPDSITANVYVPVKYGSAYAQLFSEFSNINLIDSDGTIIINRNINKLKGYSLSLDGSIGVNFRMHLSSKALEKPENSYMRFTVNGNVQKVYVKDAEFKDGQYVFRCNATAKEMADEITAQFYYDNDTPAEMNIKYSVREYAGYIINHPDEYSRETIILVEAMLNYGASSQVYFNHNTDNLANSILDDGQQHASYSGTPTFTDKGDISPAKVSLVLNSTLTLKLYLKNEDVADITSFQYGSKTLTTTVSGDYTIISIEGLKAAQFNRVLNIRCYTNGSTSYKSIGYSPANYAYIVINSNNGGVITNELKSVVYALYQFSRAALEYNASQSGQTDPTGT